MYGLGQITIPTLTSIVQRMNGKCLLFYLRPVGVFVRSVESFLITFDVQFYIFPWFLSCNVSGVTCPVAIKSIISSLCAFFSQLN